MGISIKERKADQVRGTGLCRSVEQMPHFFGMTNTEEFVTPRCGGERSAVPSLTVTSIPTEGRERGLPTIEVVRKLRYCTASTDLPAAGWSLLSLLRRVRRDDG